MSQELTAQYESELVRYLCQQVGGQGAVRKVLRKHNDLTGENDLTLTTFCEVYGQQVDFYLEASRLRDVDRHVKLSKLLTKFALSKILAEWEEKYSQRPRRFRGHSFGLVLQWPWIPPGVIVHNGPFDPDSEGSVLTWKHKGLRLTLEAVSQWVRIFSHRE